MVLLLEIVLVILMLVLKPLNPCNGDNHDSKMKNKSLRKKLLSRSG